MCEFHNDLPVVPNGDDLFILDTPAMRAFVGAVRTIQAVAPDAKTAMARIRPHFAALLADPDWLPPEYQEPAATSGMGSNTGMWLLFRAGDGSLAFSALVLAPGRETPVHDHLAWGLVGLYRGTQDEIVYHRHDDGSRDDFADLQVAERNSLTPGDFYTLLPENDIHRVRTTSDVTSVSLHLLGNDNGCIARRQYVPDEHLARPFRSGYVNVRCTRDDAPPTPSWDEVRQSVARMA